MCREVAAHIRQGGASDVRGDSQIPVKLHDRWSQPQIGGEPGHRVCCASFERVLAVAAESAGQRRRRFSQGGVIDGAREQPRAPDAVVF